MTISLKDKASAKYRDMKRKLGKKVASIERLAVRLDARITAHTRKRGEQLAVTLDRSAAKVRRASK